MSIENIVNEFIKDLQWDLRDSYNSSSCLNNKQQEFLKRKLENLLIDKKEFVVKALCLAGTVDGDGYYWGHDTNLGNFDEIVEEILNNE